MKLDYSGKTEVPLKTQSEQMPYFSKKRTDDFRNFVSMQQTVNAQLQKDKEDDKALNNDPNNVQGLPTGGAWNGTK